MTGLDMVGVHCDFCMWCQALILRDWLDKLLDDAGFTDRSPYIEYVVDYDPAAEWERIAAVCQAKMTSP